MKNYYFTFAGLRTVLRTPHEITISESLQPFLSASHPETDCAIALLPCLQLPPFSGDGLWRGLEYYDCHQGSLRIFHCNAPRTEAFAVTQHLENGNIEIRVLPEYLSYFTGTAGIFNRIGMETLLLQHHSLLLHASLIKYEGKALAFAGPSGVGKSTQADIWHHYLGADILNGDRAALRKGDTGWYAYGCPYAGTSGIYKNDHGPLAAIVLLEQAEENRLRRLTPVEAFRYLYPELSVHHWQRYFVEKATDLCLQLLADTPVYLLECRPEESAAELVKKGLHL
jgi:hypothetical protein